MKQFNRRKTGGYKMSDCKENVLEMIDAAMTANRTESFCTCRYDTDGVDRCNYCKIFEGLTVARACIVASVGRIDMMRTNMMIVQADIEEKLRILLEA